MAGFNQFSFAFSRSGSCCLWAADFTALSAGFQTTLPGGLLLSRVTGGETVQNGTAGVITSGAGTDKARIGRWLNANPLALVLEEACQNLALQSEALDDATYTKTGATIGANGVLAPDGASTGDKIIEDTGNTAHSAHQPINIGNVQLTMAAFIKSAGRTKAVWDATDNATGDANVQIDLATGVVSAGPFGAGSWTGVTGSSVDVGSGWYRTFVTATKGAGTQALPRVLAHNGVGTTYVGDGASGVYAWGYMLHTGALLMEYIPTAGSTVTRAGERLYHPTASSLMQGGRLAIELRLRPKGSSSSYTTNPRIWTSGSDYAEIDKTTRAVSVVIGGVTRTLGALPAWAAGDALDLFIEAGGGTLLTNGAARVNGGATTQLGTGAAQAALGTSAIDLLCNSTAAQFSAWVESIRAHRYGHRPSWA